MAKMDSLQVKLQVKKLHAIADGPKNRREGIGATCGSNAADPQREN